MKPGLRIKLTEYLKEKCGRWIHGGDLERFAQSIGYEGETAKRRLREMTQCLHNSFDPNIQEKTEYGCILYRYGENQKFTSSPDCCDKYRLFKTHASNCINAKQLITVRV